MVSVIGPAERFSTDKVLCFWRRKARVFFRTAINAIYVGLIEYYFILVQTVKKMYDMGRYCMQETKPNWHTTAHNYSPVGHRFRLNN